MHVVHESVNGTTETIATSVETADSFLSKARGLMFRRTVPDEYALVFRFPSPKRRSIHTLFVFVPIDVVWVVDGVVERVERLNPWRGFASAHADVIVELPAGEGASIEPGDRLHLTAPGD